MDEEAWCVEVLRVTDIKREAIREHRQ